MRHVFKFFLAISAILFINVQSVEKSFAQMVVAPNCQFQWTTVDVPDITQAVIKHGTTTGQYPDTITRPVGTNTLLCNDLPNANVVGEHFAVVEIHDSSGLKAASQEVHYRVAQSEFCILGTLNGQAVKFCVPITIQ